MSFWILACVYVRYIMFTKPEEKNVGGWYAIASFVGLTEKILLNRIKFLYQA